MQILSAGKDGTLFALFITQSVVIYMQEIQEGIYIFITEILKLL